MSLLIRGGTVLTMNDRFDVVEGDVSIRDGRIAAIGAGPRPGRTTASIDARGGYVLPGFDPDAHPSLPDAVSRLRRRSAADGLAAHARLADGSGAHAGVAARRGAAGRRPSCSASGTTTVLTMETVHDTDVVFEAVAESGLRATIGKCMMDFDAQVPQRLQEETRASIDESLALRARWDGAANGRLRAAFAPRFAVSCSRELLEAVAGLSAQHQRARPHARVGVARGDRDRPAGDPAALTNIEYLASAAPGVAAPVRGALRLGGRARAAAARRPRRQGDALPRLEPQAGSGIAPVPEMRARGITVSLGADGAACNNRLDMFEEMRLAAVLQAMRQAPGVAAGARRAVDGDARGRADARPRATRSDRSRSASAPTSSSSIAIGRTWRRARIRTRRSSTPRAAATCGRRSSTASCWWTSSRRSGSTAREIAAEAAGGRPWRSRRRAELV